MMTRDEYAALLTECVARGKREIRDEITAGTWNGDDITSFSDLHSLCDANDIGGLTDDTVNARLSYETVSGTNEPEWLVFARDVQDALNAWIVSGGHRAPTGEGN